RYCNQIDRSIAGLVHDLMCAEGVGPLIGMVVSLQDKIDVVLIENWYPLLAQGGRIAPRMGGVHRVVEDHKLPGSLGLLEGGVEPIRLASRVLGIAGGQRAVEHGETGVSAFEVVDELGIDTGRTVARKLKEFAIEPRTAVEILVVAGA